MTDPELDSRLERLAQATRSLQARSGFAERVMLRVGAAAAPTWLDAVTGLARGAFAVAAVVVLTTIGWAVQSHQAATEASAVAFFALDLEP